MICLGSICVNTLHKGDNDDDDDDDDDDNKFHASFLATTFRLTRGCQGDSHFSVTYVYYLQLFDLIKSRVSKFASIST